MYNKEHVWLTKPFFIQGPRAHEKKTLTIPHEPISKRPNEDLPQPAL